MRNINIFIVLITGIVSGFLNTVAGGGSLISMPVLIFLGLPSVAANGTNRVALVVQNIVATSNFKSKGYFDWKFGTILGLPAAIGAIVGSRIAVSLPDHVFNRILGAVMIMVLILILWEPHKRLKYNVELSEKKRNIIGAVLFFIIGIYGGIIQAGVGFIIIAGLSMITDFSLVKINSVKVFVVVIYMTISLAVFMINGSVDWILGIFLAIGNGIGAYIGSTFSVKKGDGWIKAILTATVIFMSLKLLGVFNF